MISLRKGYLPAAIILITILCSACSSKSSVPTEMIGIWRTGDVGSEGISIEFTPVSVIISSDLGVIENTITKIESEKGNLPRTTHYSVYYADRNKQSNRMNILYCSEDGGTLRFKSDEKIVWERVR